MISVGRYVEKKGFGDLIEACRLLSARGLAFTCEIIGGGPLESELAAQIAGAGLQQQVHLLGPRSQVEVRRRLAAAQIFVLACAPENDGGSDNLPTVIMEAMLSGVPVISTHLAGVPEMIESGRDGLLVAPKSPPALADAIEKLLSDRAFAEALGQRGCNAARDKFAVQKTAGGLKHLLARQRRVLVPRAAREGDASLPEPRRWQFLQRLFR